MVSGAVHLTGVAGVGGAGDFPTPEHVAVGPPAGRRPDVGLGEAWNTGSGPTRLGAAPTMKAYPSKTGVTWGRTTS